MPEMPSMEFSKLLVHTFPGFLLAMAIIMLIDSISPINIESYSISILLSLVMTTMVLGTILGIILDLMHHYFIEPIFFEKLDEYKDLIDCYENSDPNRCKKTDFIIYSIFKNCRDNAFNIINYASSDFFYYQEFYANISIALIPFSLILPFYLKHLEFPPIWIAVLSIGSIFMSFLCFYSSYKTIILFTKICMSFTCTNRCDLCNDNQGQAYLKDASKNSKLIFQVFIVYIILYIIYILSNLSIESVYNNFFVILILGFGINLILVYKKSQFPIGSLICIAVGLLIALLGINLIFIYPYVVVEPETISDNFIMNSTMIDVQTLAIKNMGPDIKDASITLIGLDQGIRIRASSYMKDNLSCFLNPTSSIGNLPRGSQRYLGIRLDVSNITVPGTYIGELLVNFESKITHGHKIIPINITISSETAAENPASSKDSILGAAA